MSRRVPTPVAVATIAIATALLAASGCASAGDAARTPTADCPSQFVPAYQGAWATVKRILARPGRVRVVILGGSGITFRQKLRAVERLQAKGVKVLDYTFTRLPGEYDESTFGDRPLRDVKAQIGKAERTYGVDGMFVDNVDDPTKLAYYRAISRFIRSQPGKFVAFNGVPAPGYVPLADALVAFEGYYDDFLRYRPAPWIDRFPAHKFVEIVHDVPRGSGPAAFAIGRRTNAGNVFFTDSGFPHPYGRMPLLATPPCG